MAFKTDMISSGISQLDRLLGGGVLIGDNVVWYDDVGSLATAFYLNFIKISKATKKFIIFVSFDRSVKSLLKQLGPLAKNPQLTILDCFTFGKGEGAEIFRKFYEVKDPDLKCQVIRVGEPQSADQVTTAFYDLHRRMEGDVRFVFDSLTGMQELWGEEEHILKFYAHTCPRLYELNTIAYWIIEKDAHSNRLRAHINKIAQVAIDLSIKRGKCFLTVIKAEKREMKIFNEPFFYWSKGLNVTFDSEDQTACRLALGSRLKKLRSRKGLSQTGLSRLVGVTPSTISQVESNQIFPSLPALFKMAEVLSVDVASFFKGNMDISGRTVFASSEAIAVEPARLLQGAISVKQIIPPDMATRISAYLIELPSKTELQSHFFNYKVDELGYLLSGKVEMRLNDEIRIIQPGDIVYLPTEMPEQWKNPGTEPAVMLWILADWKNKSHNISKKKLP